MISILLKLVFFINTVIIMSMIIYFMIRVFIFYVNFILALREKYS